MLKKTFSILADEYTTNVLLKSKKKIDKVDFPDKKFSFLARLQTNQYCFLVLNNGTNIFSYEPIKNTTQIIVEERIILDLTSDIVSIINSFLVCDRPLLATIPVSDTSPRFYLGKVDTAVDFRIIVKNDFVKIYEELLVINIRKMRIDCPTILVTPFWEFTIRGGSKTDFRKNHIDMDPFFWYVFIFAGQKIDQTLLGCDHDIFYIDFPLDDERISGKLNVLQVLFDNFRCGYNFFGDVYPNEVTHLKIGKEIISKRDPRFVEVSMEIMESKKLVSFLNIKNIKEGSMLRKCSIFEVYNNVYEFKFERKKIKQSLSIDIKKDVVLTQQEIDENIARLLEEENIERELDEIRRKERKDRDKRKKMKKKEYEEHQKLKEIAKKLAIEAKEFIVKKNLQKKRYEIQTKKENNKFSKEIVLSIIDQSLHTVSKKQSDFIEKFKIISDNLWLF